MVDYSKRLVEVDEILNYLSEEELEKIPEDIRKAIKENKDKEYVWNYDETKALKEQDVNRDTIAFISYLNIQYLLNDQQRRLMEQIHRANEIKLEKEKSEEYNSQEMFENEEKETIKETIEDKTELVVYKENIILKVFRKIKQFFKKYSKKDIS